MTCAKRRYLSQLAAARALGLIATAIPDPERPKRPVRAYRCPTCRGWHLTSQERRSA